MKITYVHFYYNVRFPFKGHICMYIFDNIFEFESKEGFNSVMHTHFLIKNVTEMLLYEVKTENNFIICSYNKLRNTIRRREKTTHFW